MTTATQTEPRISAVEVTDEAIVARLADGRIVSVPLEWSWRLSAASPKQRAHWEIIGGGQGVRWPDVDEDISVDGILRGAPARRPSGVEMRILLDASSLIDAEHGKPVSFEELDKMFREHHARLVLTFTNVMEFLAPGFEKTGDMLALRTQSQRVEGLPTVCLREGGVLRAELREAVAAFNVGRECVPVDPYVKRWDETLFPEGPSPMGDVVGQSLYDLVRPVLSRGDPLPKAKKQWGGRLGQQFEADRALPQKVRTALAENFRGATQRYLEFYAIDFPADRVDKLAAWIYSDPATRCPGLRLTYDWRQDLMNNVAERFEANDIFDRPHVSSVPYVDAVTMDRNAAAHCRNVAKRLTKINHSISYEGRIFTSLEDLLAAKF